jgi:hypothetical protein
MQQFRDLKQKNQKSTADIAGIYELTEMIIT